MWHCAVRAAPEDKTLSDAEWAQIAADVMHRTGLAPYGQDDEAVRWVAVRHGDDHIHIVAMLARQDGGRPRLSNERYRVREACRAAEERYGLRRTAPGDRTAARRPTRAENEKARRRGWRETPRVTLKRAVSTAAAEHPASRTSSPASPAPACWSASASARVTPRGHRVCRRPARRLRQGRRAGLVRRREARRRPDPAQAAPPLGPGPRRAQGRSLPQERDAFWEHAAQAARDASAQIRSQAATSPGRAPMPPGPLRTRCTPPLPLGSRVLRQAADATTGPPAPRTADSRTGPQAGTACGGPRAC